jgi:hypothetical protein
MLAFFIPSRLTLMQQAYCIENMECNSIYNLRNTQSSEVPSGPQDSTTLSGSARPSMTSGTTTLPSRQRNPSSIDPERASTDNSPQHFFPHMQSHHPEITLQSGVVDVDMDFSPDFGLSERNPPSDHPTPSTLNSSSNTSYSISGAENPSPGKKHQKSTTSSATSFDKVNTIHISPSTTESPQIPDMSAMAGQVYPNSTSSMGASNASNAFNMTSQWDMPTPSSILNNVDFGNVNVDSLSEAQWAQILNNSGNGTGWADWRPS